MVRSLQGRRPRDRQVRIPPRPATARANTNNRWAESEEYKGKIYFAKFDVDHLPELAAELGIRAMPTFILFKNGDKVDEVLGGNPTPIQVLLKKALDE